MSPLPAGVSKTSIYVTAGRAVGAREPDESVRNPDYLAERLLGDPAALGLDHPIIRAMQTGYADAVQDPEAARGIRMMMVRTRFIDACVKRAVAAGAKQLVILGAGLDTRPYRFRELLSDVRVFEVDRPETQSWKRQRVQEVLGEAPPNLAYVAIDFDKQDLSEALSRAGCDAALRTLFIWEGVTMYLPEAAVTATLRLVASYAPGSSIVFDFVYRWVARYLATVDVDRIPEERRRVVERLRSIQGEEPFQFAMPDGGEREFLEQAGLEAGEPLSVRGEAAVQQYLTRRDGSIVGGTPPHPRVTYCLIEARAGASKLVEG